MIENFESSETGKPRCWKTLIIGHCEFLLGLCNNALVKGAVHILQVLTKNERGVSEMLTRRVKNMLQIVIPTVNNPEGSVIQLILQSHCNVGAKSLNPSLFADVC